MALIVVNEKNKLQINRKFKKNQIYKVTKGIYVNEPKEIFIYLEDIFKALQIRGTIYFKSAIEYKNNITNKELFIITKNIKSNITLGENKDLILSFIKESASTKLDGHLLERISDTEVFIPKKNFAYLIQFTNSKIYSKRANKELACELMSNDVLSIYKDISYVKYTINELDSFSKKENLVDNFNSLKDFYRAYLIENYKNFDKKRIAMLQGLKETLDMNAFSHYKKSDENILFYEAYFSNYIEGTEFEIDEAENIIFNPSYRYTRHKDGHDIICTYRILKNIYSNPIFFKSFTDFIGYLKAIHLELMEHRKEDILVGEFKKKPNKSGNLQFVLPSLVNMTLEKGYELYEKLDDPVKKAIFIHVLLSEVHPFDDGNGRISRIFMNNELSKAGLCHIIIPTVFREDYITALKGFSHQGNSSAIINSLIKAYKITNQIKWDDKLSIITEYIRNNSGFEKDTNSIWGISPEMKEESKISKEIPDFF